MAKKKQSESVYRIIDVVGVSEESWEDASALLVHYRLCRGDFVSARRQATSPKALWPVY